MFDFLIVGSGLFGAVCANLLNKKGYKCLVIEKRDHIAGNIFTEEIEGIDVHKYGAHIFHTSNKDVWDWVNQFATFNNYINQPVARYKNELYNLPFNMNTFTKLWKDVFTPEQAKNRIEEEKQLYRVENPSNLEEQAINLVGISIYEKLIKGYTAKQWGKQCTELPAFIIKRLPVRFVFDNNYFDDVYQGIPIGGYTKMVEKMLNGIEVRLNTNYFDDEKAFRKMAKYIIFTGQIDEFYDYCFGALEYRKVDFKTEILDCDNYQGNAVVNYTDYEIPYTRIIEHKHFVFGKQPKTIISKEYSSSWKKGDEPYYPINNAFNNSLYLKYKELADADKRVFFGGRLGLYKYFDMDDTIVAAKDFVENLTRNIKDE